MTPHVAERLHAYRDGELSVVEAAEVEQHVEACPACAARLLLLAEVDDLVRAEPVPEGPRDGFSTRVRARIAAGVHRAPRRTIAWPWLAAAAALVMAAVIVPQLRWSALPEPASRPAVADAPAAGGALTAPSPPPAAAPAPPTSVPPAPETKELRSLGYVGSPAEEPRLRRAAPAPPAKLEADAAPPPPPPPPPAPAQAAPAAPAPMRAVEGRRDQAAGAAARDEDLAAFAENALPEELPAAEAPAAAKPDGRAGGVAGFAAPPAEAQKTQAEKESAALRAAPPKDALAKRKALANRTPRSLAEARELREAWRAEAARSVETRAADHARVQVVAMGAAALALGGDDEDRARFKADADAYLAREDAAGKDRVRALVQGAER
jgi:hypothetical protein